MKTLQAFSNELAAAVEQAGKSVVAVHAHPRHSSSGILWKAGVVVTAEHTVPQHLDPHCAQQDDDITVTMPDGSTVSATLVGRDAGSDLAVLTLTGTDPAIVAEASSPPSVEIANVADVKAGQLVLAVARSREDGIGTSLGVVSCRSGSWRTWRGGQLDYFVQPDLTLYPGFSGGALITVEGRIIGVNTAGLSRSMSITVPASTVSARVDELLAQGHISRAYLGLGMHGVALPPSVVTKLKLAAPSGVIVLSVEEDGPADRGGIVVGDVLLSLGGTTVSHMDEVLSYLSAAAHGDTVDIALLRGGVPHSVTITLGERPR